MCSHRSYISPITVCRDGSNISPVTVCSHRSYISSITVQCAHIGPISHLSQYSVLTSVLYLTYHSTVCSHRSYISSITVQCAHIGPISHLSQYSVLTSVLYLTYHSTVCSHRSYISPITVQCAHIGPISHLPQCADTGPTGWSFEPITLGSWQGSHYNASFQVGRVRDLNHGPPAMEVVALITWPWKKSTVSLES